MASLKPWGKNPRSHKVDAIVGLVRRFGFGAPLLARKKNLQIIGGHGRRLAVLRLLEEGAKPDDHAEVAHILKTRSVPVRLMDLTANEAEAQALADNASMGEWDEEGVAAILRELQANDVEIAGLGWDQDELAALLAEPVTEGVDEGPGEVPTEALSKPGEIYELGPHRVACIDSTDAEAVASLFGGEMAALVWTDPPYGVAYQSKMPKDEAAKRHRRLDGLEVANDALTPEATETLVRSALSNAAAHSVAGGGVYVASPSGEMLARFISAFAPAYEFKHSLVWVKDQFVMGRADYHYRHETILYGWKGDGPHFFVDDRKQDSVFEFPRPKRSEFHPTMKSVELVERMVANSSKPGELVFDPFTGSGTTLIACAKIGRRFVGCELDARYVDVIRRRATDFFRSTGLDPGSGALEPKETAHAQG